MMDFTEDLYVGLTWKK